MMSPCDKLQGDKAYLFSSRQTIQDGLVIVCVWGGGGGYSSRGQSFVQSQKLVIAYFSSKQLLPFDFAGHIDDNTD